MDKVSEILDNIKDRFSNPLIFSFVCAWLVFNWEITIALLWYDDKQINAEGYRSIFEFIRDKLNNNSTWCPIIFAICYTLLIPFIKNLIKALYTWTTKWGDSLNLWLSKGGKVKMEKYLKLRANYIDRTKRLDDIISQEQEYSDEINKLTNDVFNLKEISLQTDKNVRELNKIIESIHDVSFLNGYWNFSISSKNAYNENGILTKEIQITDGMYYEVAENRLVHKYKIQNFFFNRKTGTIFFVKKNIITNNEIEEDTYRNTNLYFENENYLTGHESEYYDVNYRRISQIQFIEKKNKI